MVVVVPGLVTARPSVQGGRMSWGAAHPCSSHVGMASALRHDKNVMDKRIAWTGLMNTLDVVSLHIIVFVCPISCPFWLVLSSSCLPFLSAVCRAPSYGCSDGRCIPRGNVCDGEFDCLDGGDESNCQCTSVL